MFAWLVGLVLLSMIDLADPSQADDGGAPRYRRSDAARAEARPPGGDEGPASSARRETSLDGQGPPDGTRPSAAPPRDASVIADHLVIFDQSDEGAFATGRARRGDRVRVRGRAAGGWAAIDPPSTTIGWIERGALEPGDGAGGRGSHRPDPSRPESGPGTPTRAWVAVPRALVRSGRLEARMPGPPWVELPRGAIVRLVDRPPLPIGRGPEATVWLAIVPPAEAACYVHAEGLEEPPRRQGVSEVLAAYLVPDGGDKAAGTSAGALPPGVAAEIARVDASHRAILTTQPIDQWRLDPIRADYQAILKRSGDHPAVEEALRSRLAQVTRHEQAAAAAREFQEVLSRSRRRDDQVAWLRQRLAAVDRYRTISYHGVGFVQASSRRLDGRKLHVLIDRQGQTIAYLDIPPGLDVQAIGTKRVGVRGAVHFSQELGTRIITVRDMEPVSARR